MHFYFETLIHPDVSEFVRIQENYSFTSWIFQVWMVAVMCGNIAIRFPNMQMRHFYLVTSILQKSDGNAWSLEKLSPPIFVSHYMQTLYTNAYVESM